MKTKKKNGKIKRICIATIATLCAISSAVGISAYAATINSNYTIEVGGAPGSMDSMILNHSHSGTRKDMFGNYPTIYDNKTYAKGTSRVYYSNYSKYREGYSNNNVKGFTLQKNSPSYPLVTYGNIPKGECQHRFYYSSGGGFKTSVKSSTTY